MKSEVYFEKVRHLNWLKDIVKDYRGHAEAMKKAPFDTTIQSVSYSIKGGNYRIEVNPHHPLHARWIYGGLMSVIEDELEKEIAALEEELKKVVVEL